MVHEHSADVVVFLVVDHVDEVHGVLVEAEQAQPLLEVGLFIFDSFHEIVEEGFHLFLEGEHLGDLGVRILADDVF